MLDVEISVRRRALQVEAAFGVAPGERLALFGPSGAGKTTILEVVAGLLRPDRGHVVLGGRTLTREGEGARGLVDPWARRVGLLRQHPGLFPHLSVRENIAYSRAAATAGPQLDRIAERLEIAHLLRERPRALSGGQAHRVALARLLLAGDDVLLLDEPYTGLDGRLRRVLTDVVREESASRRVPSILVAHELTEAQAFADRMAVLDEGRIAQVGTPVEVVRRPCSRRVAELVGYLGFVPGEAVAAAGAADRLAGWHVGVHPDRCRAGAAPDEGVVLRGMVTGSRPAGAVFEVDVAVAAGAGEATTLTCRSTADPPPAGSPWELTVLDPPWFRADGRLATAPQPVRA